MKAYFLDEITSEDLEQITQFLTDNASRSTMAQIFWVQFPEDLLSPLQFQHTACQPHVFAVELGSDWVKLEFLVRSLQTMKCDCAAYCTGQQRDYIINFADRMLEQLKVST